MRTNVLHLKFLNTNRFFDLKNSGNELVLVSIKNEEMKIPYSNLKKIYIKKNKFNSRIKTVFSLLLILVLFLAMLTSHPEFIIVPLLLSLPLLSKTNRFKSYYLQVELQDGTLFSKRFYSDKKHFYINTVNRIKSDLFYYQINGYQQVE
jgi:hypothetical protein